MSSDPLLLLVFHQAATKKSLCHGRDRSQAHSSEKGSRQLVIAMDVLTPE